jgi:hypothetical protein
MARWVASAQGFMVGGEGVREDTADGSAALALC